MNEQNGYLDQNNMFINFFL